MEGMNYYLSQDKAASYKDELITEALKRLKARAETIAKQVGLPHVNMVEVSISNEYNRPEPMMTRMETFSMAKSVSMAPPVAIGGDETVALTINATIMLTDK